MPDQSTKDAATAALAQKYPPPAQLDRVAKLAANLTFYGNHRLGEILELCHLTAPELAKVKERQLYRDEIKRLEAKAGSKK